MKLLIFIYAGLILSIQLNAQVYYDSINDKDYIYENSYLSSSSNILAAYSKGISVENITVSESDIVWPYNKDSIVSIELKDNHLIVLVHKKFPACKKFLFEISIVNDSLLNLLYYDFGNSCISSSNYVFKHDLMLDKSNVEKLNRIKYVIINNTIDSKRELKISFLK